MGKHFIYEKKSPQNTGGAKDKKISGIRNWMKQVTGSSTKHGT